MTAGVDLPSWQGAANARTLMGAALRAVYRVHVTGVDRVPTTGPILLVANHPGALDGAVIVSSAPRPVHMLADESAWPAPVSRWSRAVGDIPVRRDVLDRTALHRAVAALEDARAVGCFPQRPASAGGGVRPGAGYLVARTSAEVVPVALAGTHGRHPGDPPRPGSRIDVVFGAPVRVDVRGVDPLVRSDVVRLAERVRQILTDHVRLAAERAGRAFDGPRADRR